MINILVRKKYKHGKVLKKTFANKLAIKLGIGIRSRKYNYPYEDKLLINWGNSYYKGKPPLKILNSPLAVQNAIDKLKTLELLYNNNIPRILYANSLEGARMLFNHSDKIYCRTLINSSKGKGIVIANSSNELVDAPLYTAHYPMTNEYRYHVFNGKVIHVQEKRKRSPEKLEELGLVHNPLIRNFDNGYVFCMKNVTIYSEVEESCIKAVSALGLDFAAIDVGVIIDEEGFLISHAIIEVNTAPALVNTTFTKYKNAIQSYIEAL